MTDYIDKGWGREVIFAREPDYAGKLLEFDRKGACMSIHFHREKDETWHVIRGSFELTTIDLATGQKQKQTLNEGDTWRNPPMLPHRLECLSDGGVVVEASTFDDPEDNYRVAPGDSQYVG